MRQIRRQLAASFVDTVIECVLGLIRVVLRMVADGKVELIMAVSVDSVVSAGSDEA